MKILDLKTYQKPNEKEIYGYVKYIYSVYMAFSKKLTFQCQIQNKTELADNWHKASECENICIKACN